MDSEVIDFLVQQLARIEGKLDALIASLAGDDDEHSQYSLDGDLQPPDRGSGLAL